MTDACTTQAPPRVADPKRISEQSGNCGRFIPQTLGNMHVGRWGDGAYQTRVIATGPVVKRSSDFHRRARWMEQHATDTEYETEFGEVVEDASTVVQAVSLRADLLERAKRHAAEKGESLSGLIARLLENEIR